MALWQVGFFVLPKTSIEYINLFKVTEEHSFDDAPYWKPLKIDPNFFDSITNILEKSVSWSKCIILFGEENSHRLEVFVEKNIVLSVSFRIDFTSNYEAVLKGIIQFCILNGLIILNEKLEVVPLNYELAKSIIENAPQVKKYNNLLNGLL